MSASATGKRLRVAFVAPAFPTFSDSVTGIYHYKRAQALAESADVTVICLSPAYRPWRVQSAAESFVLPGDGAPPLTIRRLMYPSLRRLTRSFNSLLARRALTPTLEACAPELVLSYWLYPEGFAATNAAHRLGLPAIAGAIGSDLRLALGPLARRRVGRALRAADHVVTVSEELRQRALEHGLPAVAVTTVRNGCDTRVFHVASRAEARQMLGVPQDDELVLFVGRLVVAKGLRELVAAVGSLAAARPTLRLAVAGEGPLKAELLRLASQHDLKSRVLVLGAQPGPEVARWLVAADLLCLPSYSEGCPNVVLEALSCGRPVVASAVGGVPELVADDCSILVPPADERALAAGLLRALERRWDEGVIASRHTRRWSDVGRELHQLCLSAAGRQV